MKLIFCKSCNDVIALRKTKIRTCFCGISSGKYIDDLNAEIYGPCIPLGFANDTFKFALKNQPSEGMGRGFAAFIIPKKCNTVKLGK